MDARLERMDAHMERGNELMAQIREQHQLNLREHERCEAAFNATRDSIRAMTAEIHENTRTLKDIQDGIKASNKGLLRVLDRLDEGFGPLP